MTEVAIVAGEHPLAMDDEFCDWLRAHDVQPDETYKVVIETSTDEMTVYQYATDEDGRKYVVCSACGGKVSGQTKEEHAAESGCQGGMSDAARKDPFKVAITETAPPALQAETERVREYQASRQQ